MRVVAVMRKIEEGGRDFMMFPLVSIFGFLLGVNSQFPASGHQNNRYSRLSIPGLRVVIAVVFRLVDVCVLSSAFFASPRHDTPSV